MKKQQKIRVYFSDFKIPFIIPKRSKGSIECLCKCSFKTVFSSIDHFNPLDFISFVSRYSNSTCDSNLLLSIGKEIVKLKKLSFFNMKVDLFYHMERVSSTYKVIGYEMPSFYEIEYSNYKWSNNIGIELPVRVVDTSITAGRLKYKLINHNQQHFEDLIEHIQHTVGFKLYPLSCQEDDEGIQSMLDKGTIPYNYLYELKKRVQDKHYAKGGSISLIIPDLYNMYKFDYKIDF